MLSPYVKGKCAMKIGKISVTACFALLLGGCSFNEIAGLPPEPEITSPYTAVCAVTSYITPPDGEETEFCFSGNIKRLGTGFWEMELTSPDTLKGLKVALSGDVVNSSLGELTFSMPAEKMPDLSPFMEIFSVLDSAASAAEQGETLVSGENGGWVLSTEGSTIIFDGNGCPVSMASSYPRLTAEITEFKLITESTVTAPEETSAQTTAPTLGTTVTVTGGASETTVPAAAAETSQTSTARSGA